VAYQCINLLTSKGNKAQYSSERLISLVRSRDLNFGQIRAVLDNKERYQFTLEELFEIKEAFRNSTQLAVTNNSNRWSICHICGGDGGPGGRCWRCGGNGFEPWPNPSRVV